VENVIVFGPAPDYLGLRLVEEAYMTSMTQATAIDKFYGPLKQVARDYIPLLMARMRVLEQRAAHAIEFLEDEADEAHEIVWEMDEAERISSVAEAQTDLHKSVLEAGTAQALVGAFIELLEEDYRKIRDSKCYFINPQGEHVSLYADQELNDP
jgi:hypothetical protein